VKCIGLPLLKTDAAYAQVLWQEINTQIKNASEAFFIWVLIG